jgi:hypothetical protein
MDVASAGKIITEVFCVPETGCIGYGYRIEGRPVHYTLDTCLSLEAALDACDVHREHVREEASDADETKLLISRSVKPGSVMERLSRPSSGDRLTPTDEGLPTLPEADCRQRFKFVASHGTKEMQVYALMVGRGGPGRTRYQEKAGADSPGPEGFQKVDAAFEGHTGVRKTGVQHNAIFRAEKFLLGNPFADQELGRLAPRPDRSKHAS